jgi:hypothetical protein
LPAPWRGWDFVAIGGDGAGRRGFKHENSYLFDATGTIVEV